MRDDRATFCAALLAEQAAIPAAADIFAPFIGSWDLVVRWFAADGSVARRELGEWHFARVLEGRAIQDVWIVPPRGERGDGYEYGTSLRFYDPAIDAWQSTWIGPVHGVVHRFVARRDGDAVVLATPPGVEPPLRWSLSEITADSFAWRNEISTAQGWHVQQDFAATRR